MRFRRIRVDAKRNRNKMLADTNESAIFKTRNGESGNGTGMGMGMGMGTGMGMAIKERYLKDE